MKQFPLFTAVIFSIAIETEAFAPHSSLRWRQAVACNQLQIVEQMLTLYSHDDDLRQAEDDAAFDAHDCPDAGMEAAAEERAVMMAESMHLKPKHDIHAEQTSSAASAEKAVPAPHISMEKVGNAELEQAEEDAAYDAHDCSDAGMEAAAEERAVMMAYEMAEKKKARKQSGN